MCYKLQYSTKYFLLKVWIDSEGLVIIKFVILDQKFIPTLFSVFHAIEIDFYLPLVYNHDI